jgi:hypothetical protein
MPMSRARKILSLSLAATALGCGGGAAPPRPAPVENVVTAPEPANPSGIDPAMMPPAGPPPTEEPAAPEPALRVVRPLTTPSGRPACGNVMTRSINPEPCERLD